MLFSNFFQLQNIKDNPPCNTLFIGNLGENINEEELRSLLSAQPGFKQMKILRQERHTVCFIEFEVNSETFTICVYVTENILLAYC
jgi:RNA recognition motif-containing protein